MELNFRKVLCINLIGKEGCKYKVIDKIDRGGGGNVFVCVDDDENQFAVKIFSRLGRDDTERSRKRFINTYSFLYQLKHENVIPVIDYEKCKYDGNSLPFYIMLIARENLKDYFKRNEIKEKTYEVERILNQILDGLIYLHNEGYVHRDIKPKNILVFPDNKIKIADLDIGHIPDKYKKESIETLPEDYSQKGFYKTIEERASDDPRADIFALGKVIMHLLTGGKQEAGIIISQVNHSFSRRFDNIIAKMTKDNIDERYPSLIEVKKALLLYFNTAETKLRNSLDDEIYRKFFDLDQNLAEEFDSAVSLLKQENLSRRFSQSANSFQYICKILQKHLDRWYSEALFIPKRSRELKEQLLNELNNICQFFTIIADHEKDTNKPEFEGKIEEFEKIVKKLLKSNINVINALDNLLEKKNPVLDDVDELISLLSNPSHSQYFFTRLKSPKWLDLLIEKEFFSNPPEHEIEQPLMIHIWPQINYLINISSIRPQKVLSILNDISPIVHFSINRSILLCINNMPVEISKQALPLIKKLSSNFSIAESIYLKKLVKAFIFEKEIESVYSILEIILIKEGKRQKKEFLLSDDVYYLILDYQDIFDQLIIIDKNTKELRVLRLLCKILSFNLYLNSNNDSDKVKDYSEIWRTSIKSESDIYETKDTKNLLVNKIRDYFSEIDSTNHQLIKEGFKILEKYELTIFKRIRLFIINAFPNIFSEELLKYLCNENFFFDDKLWSEYYTLLKNHFPKLSENQKQLIFEWIKKGPKIQFIEKDFDTTQKYEKFKSEVISAWLRRRMEPIHRYLKPELREKYENLIKKFGKIEEPQFYNKMEHPRFFSGSPLKDSELKSLKISELISYLQKWQPNEKDFLASKSGLGVALYRLISENTEKFEILLDYLDEIPFYYFSHIIRGFSSSLKKNKPLQIAKKVDKIIQTFRKYENDYTLKQYYEVSKAIFNFVQEALNIENIKLSNEIINQVRNFILDMLTLDKFESKKYQNLSQYEDIVAYSINTFKGNLILTFLSYAVYHGRNMDITKKDKMTSEVKEVFNKLLDPGIGSAEIIRSILCSHLNIIFYLNKEWLLSNIKELFPEKNKDLWRIGWESYIAYSDLNPIIYEVLRNDYRNAIVEFQKYSFSNKMSKGLAGHIILLYVYDLAELNDKSIIHLFFENVDLQTRSNAMWFILHLWDNNKGTAQEGKILHKILNIWEYRINQIQNIESLDLKKFERELKWYPRLFNKLPKGELQIMILTKVIELIEGRIETSIIDIMDVLKKYTEKYPNLVLKNIEYLLKGSQESYFIGRDEIKIIKIMEIIAEKGGIKVFRNELKKITELLLSKGHYEIKNAQFYPSLNIS